MVQPNTRIYPVPYITEKMYSKFEAKLNELAKAQKTEIKYNYAEQCFEIKGRSQQACDETSTRIEMHLLPQLNRVLDENNFIGTFEDLTSMRESPRPSPITSPIETNGITSRANSMVSTTSSITGRPLNLEEVEKAHAQTHLRAAAANNNNADGEREAYYRYETESDESEESDEEYVETFTFAKNIADPKEVLTGQITNNTKALDYLRIIGNDTATECSLHGRNVKIVGKDEDTIKEALNRFRNLQAMFKRRKRPTTIVPCVHYPEPSQFGVYFCPMQKYAHQNWVSTFNQPGTPYFVMLPVTKDRNGNYRKPKDLLAAPPAQHQVQPSPQLVMQQQLSLDERMRQATLEHKRNDFGNQSAGMAPDLTTLWGENKLFRVNSSASGPSSSSKSSTPSNGRMMQPQQPRQQPVNDFPSLPSGSSPKPSIKKQQPNTRRVLRVTNQKASAAVATPQKSNLDIVREYNLHNIKTALEDGLSGVRGFKGKVKLSARLGKVLWTKVNTNLQKQIWEFQDIKDIAMGHHGIEPVFNDMTSKSLSNMQPIYNVLPEAYSKSGSFEIYANARNQPSMPYQKVVIHMSETVVEWKRIVTKASKVTEIDWVSLDRKFDFQLLLKTEELAERTDVKPYNTFLRKVAVDPQTMGITYENVPGFLEVTHILHKTTTKYRIHFPFVVEITGVEMVPISQQKFNGFNIEKSIGDTGRGQVWYEVDVYYSTYEEIFKGNTDLPVGKLASWTVQDVIGHVEDPASALVEFIRCLLILVEKVEKNLTSHVKRNSTS